MLGIGEIGKGDARRAGESLDELPPFARAIGRLSLTFTVIELLIASQ